MNGRFAVLSPVQDLTPVPYATFANSSTASTIGGGVGNTGNYATIQDGYFNLAGTSNPLAAGTFARATNQGSFVWSDNSSSTPSYSAGNNTFNIRAEGGVKLVTSGAGMTLDGQSVLAIRRISGRPPATPMPTRPRVFFLGRSTICRWKSARIIFARCVMSPAELQPT